MEEIGSVPHIPKVGCLGWIFPHFFMGLVAVALGLWWAGKIFGNFYEFQYGSRPFRSQLFYLGPIRALPVEPWCLVLLPGFQALVIVAYGVIYSEIAGIRHLGFVLPFVSLGLVELMIHRKVALPGNLDAAIFIIAFYLKAFMTYMHLTGLPPLITQGHMHLVLNDICIILAMLLELRYRESAICALVRPYLFLVEGTWMVQNAFVQSACSFVSWDFDDPHLVMNQAASFTWHYMVHFWVMFLIGCSVWRYKRSVQNDFAYKQLPSEVA